MRQAKILFKGTDDDLLTQRDDETFTIQHHNSRLNDDSLSPVSLTIPKQEAPYKSEFLFPFFLQRAT